MVRLYLLAILILLGYVLVKKFLGLSLVERKKHLKDLLIGGSLLLFLVLAASGKLAWFFAILGVALAFLLRNLPFIIRYAPYLQRLWRGFRYREQSAEDDVFQDSGFTGNRPKKNSASMTVAEAYKILGLSPNASRDEIVLAHKKLMQKVHPDRGGSDYLAAQINLAKEILLKR